LGASGIFDYRTVDPVDDALAMQMTDLCAAWAKARPPWKDGFRVHSRRGSLGDGKPKHLFGRMTVALQEYEPAIGRFREIDSTEQALIAYADTRWAMEQLLTWSRLYGVTWEVDFGELKGRVGPSGPNPGAARIIWYLRSAAGHPSESQVEAMRAALDHKYADRRP
jgi:hypothetical protein